MKKLITFGFLTVISAFITKPGWATGNPAHGKKLYSICVACHGTNGEGRKITNAPRISGQQPWYVKRQLRNYRDGIRGVHIDDITGMQMRSIALMLKTDQEIADVAAYVSTLKTPDPKPTLNGDIEAGRKAFASCVACHGADGTGNKELNAPSISGLQDWYVFRQLGYFKKGVRGRIQRDTSGQQMRPMAIPLDDATINNLAVYIATLDESTTVTGTYQASKDSSALSMAARMASAKPGSLESSELLYVTCTPCHGANGEGKMWLGAPRLSGQNGWYLERQLNNWKKGIRGTHPGDVYGMQMRPMSMTLSDDAAVKKVVNYIGTLESPKPQTTVQGDLQAGQGLYGTCIACHGPAGMGNKDLNAPKITGLPDWYVVKQLKGFKEGYRGQHPQDFYGQQMRPMAIALSDEKAILNVSVYIASFDESGLAPAAVATVVSAEQPEPSSGSENQISIISSQGGSVEKGKTIYTTCIACHGADGAGNQALNAPRIAGQSDWYLTRQLNGFKAGYRGTNPEDLYGQQMRPMSMILADDQSVADVVAYIRTLKGAVAPAALSGDAEAGKGSYATCVACHGSDALGNKALNAPNLAGLQDWYIARQLKNFKKGIRGAHAEDTYGQQMRPMSMILADDNTINNVVAHILSLRK